MSTVMARDGGPAAYVTSASYRSLVELVPVVLAGILVVPLDGILQDREANALWRKALALRQERVRALSSSFANPSIRREASEPAT
jgi:hypothetical protein